MREHANSKFPDFRLRNPGLTPQHTADYGKGVTAQIQAEVQHILGVA